jgi:hypothetical protein
VIPLLNLLLENKFTISGAWNATSEWDCPLMMPTYAQLILRLESPDERIKEFGFVSDSTRLQIYGVVAGCVPYWEQYMF